MTALAGRVRIYPPGSGRYIRDCLGGCTFVRVQRVAAGTTRRGTRIMSSGLSLTQLAILQIVEALGMGRRLRVRNIVARAARFAESQQAGRAINSVSVVDYAGKPAPRTHRRIPAIAAIPTELIRAELVLLSQVGKERVAIDTDDPCEAIKETLRSLRDLRFVKPVELRGLRPLAYARPDGH